MQRLPAAHPSLSWVVAPVGTILCLAIKKQKAKTSLMIF